MVFGPPVLESYIIALTRLASGSGSSSTYLPTSANMMMMEVEGARSNRAKRLPTALQELALEALVIILEGCGSKQLVLRGERASSSYSFPSPSAAPVPFFPGIFMPLCIEMMVERPPEDGDGMEEEEKERLAQAGERALERVAVLLYSTTSGSSKEGEGGRGEEAGLVLQQIEQLLISNAVIDCSRRMRAGLTCLTILAEQIKEGIDPLAMKNLVSLLLSIIEHQSPSHHHHHHHHGEVDIDIEDVKLIPALQALEALMSLPMLMEMHVQIIPTVAAVCRRYQALPQHYPQYHAQRQRFTLQGLRTLHHLLFFLPSSSSPPIPVLASPSPPLLAAPSSSAAPLLLHHLPLLLDLLLSAPPSSSLNPSLSLLLSVLAIYPSLRDKIMNKKEKEEGEADLSGSISEIALTLLADSLDQLSDSNTSVTNITSTSVLGVIRDQLYHLINGLALASSSFSSDSPPSFQQRDESHMYLHRSLRGLALYAFALLLPLLSSDADSREREWLIQELIQLRRRGRPPANTLAEGEEEEEGLDEEDPQRSWSIKAWMVVARCQGPLFAPYLPLRLSLIRASMKMVVEVDVQYEEEIYGNGEVEKEDEENDEEEDEETLRGLMYVVDEEGYDRLMKTALFEEQEAACQALASLFEDKRLKGSLLAIPSSVISSMAQEECLPLLQSTLSDDVRNSLLRLLPHALRLLMSRAAGGEAEGAWLMMTIRRTAASIGQAMLTCLKGTRQINVMMSMLSHFLRFLRCSSPSPSMSIGSCLEQSTLHQWVQELEIHYRESMRRLYLQQMEQKVMRIGGGGEEGGGDVQQQGEEEQAEQDLQVVLRGCIDELMMMTQG